MVHAMKILGLRGASQDFLAQRGMPPRYLGLEGHAMQIFGLTRTRREDNWA